MTLEHQTQYGKGLEQVHRTSRNFEHYTRVFGYDEDGTGLVGVKILDIGAGDSDFAQLINENDTLGSLVTRVDPKYAQQPPAYNELAEAAFVQDLPFTDDTFDEVISSWGIAKIQTGTKDALREMVRVVKVGRKVKLFPVSLASRDPNTQLPAQASFIYDEDPKKIYSNRTLQITKEEGITDEAWSGIFDELLKKLDISEEEIKTDSEKVA